MRYPESVEFLYALGNEIKSAKFGLDGIRALVAALGNPQDSFRVIHVAGTNGKGSTCAMIEAGLRAAGLKTGLYTSPHLIEPTERIQIDGVPVTAEQFTAAFDRVHAAAERLVAEGVLEHHTTYFETVTAMGFELIREARIDIGVIEVGLGGRLDATNVVKPELCVITPIDFDHEQFLGNSLQLIAGEKAGILKPGVPAIFAPQRPEALEVLNARAAELGIHVTHVDDSEPVHSPLAGRHQQTNARTAVATLRRLNIPPRIEGARWPGRLEKVSASPEIVLDGAHNPAGARALAAHLRECYAGREVWIVFGAMRDKSVQEITEILFPLADTVVLTAPDQPRAVRPEALRGGIDHPRVEIAPSAADAWRFAKSAPPQAAVFITGSLYLIGEVRRMVC